MASFEVPFVEKYRPVTLNEVVGNADAVDSLRIIAAQGNLPNLILSGPPGTGKTTSIHCLAREMLGDAAQNAVLELNASDDRGIEVVRSKIKMFAQKKVTLPEGKHKIIILDEADSMTSAAQQALRRTMELYSATTRFALACNTSSKIIEPIQSRCAILRFSRLSDTDVLTRLQEVAQMEEITCTPEGLEAIIFTSEGDMRNALNTLQATSSGFGLVDAENVFKVSDQPHPRIMKAAIDKCREGDLRGAVEEVRGLCNNGYSAPDIISTLFRVCKAHESMSEGQKLEYLREIGFAHMRIVEGLHSPLQIYGCLARLARIGSPSSG